MFNLYLASLMHECPFQTLDILHNPLEYRKELFHLGIAHKTPRKIDHLHRPTKVLSVAIQKFKNVLVILDDFPKSNDI